MLVIGRVVDAGRQQHDSRIAGGGFRRERLQRGEQFVRIVLDRRHAMAREQLREQPHHDLAVLQHVGDARRRAGVVLENIKRVGIDADHVDAGDVHVDVVRHLLAVHLRPEHRILEHQALRHDAGLENFAAAVDVAQISVDRLDALLKPAAQRVPFLRRQDARDDVERDQPLLGVGLAIDREGDADAAEQQLGFLAAVFEHIGPDVAEPARQFGIGRANLAVGPLHLVERQAHRLHSPTRRALNVRTRGEFPLADIASLAPIGWRRKAPSDAQLPRPTARIMGTDWPAHEPRRRAYEPAFKALAARLTTLRNCRTTGEGSPRRDTKLSGAFSRGAPFRRR